MWDEKAAFERAAQGDEAAFETIVKQYEKKIWHVALQALGNSEDAKDVTQEVFVRLWKTLPRFRWECSPASWILRITRTVTVDHCRKRRGRETDPLSFEDENGEAVEVDPPDTDPAANPPEAFVRQETIEAVRQAIGDLPAKYGEILMLRDISGLSYSDIAEYLGIDVGTVKSRLARARAALKNLLTERNIL